MTSSLDMIRGRQVVEPLTNQSGGAIIAGDVVIVSAANDESFTTTTSAAYNSTRVGVAQESIAAAATGRILLEGYAPLVNVSASATRGHYLLTHTVAKQATSQAGYAAGAFGQILKAGTTPSAMIFPVAQVGSAGVGRSGSTTDGHLAVWNGSDADSIKDGGVAGGGGAPTTSKYVTTAADAGLSAEVVIPGLAGSPDVAPAGANDDEFDALSGWTTLGTLDTSNVTDFKSLWHVKRATAGVEVNGIYKAVPTIPFTVTTHIKFADLRANAHPSCGIMLLDATPTAIRCFEINQVSATLYMSLRRYTNRTTFSTSVDAVLLSGVVAYTEVPDIYLKLLVTSTSDVTFSYSTNGFFYIPVTGVITIDPTITVTYVGLEISDPIGASTTEAAFDWIRFT